MFFKITNPLCAHQVSVVHTMYVHMLWCCTHVYFHEAKVGGDIPRVRTSTAKYAKRNVLSLPYDQQWSNNMCPHQLMHGANSVFAFFHHQGLIQMDGQSNVTFTDIVAVDGYIHSIDGLLIPPDIEPLIPHRCDRKGYVLEQVKLFSIRHTDECHLVGEDCITCRYLSTVYSYTKCANLVEWKKKTEYNFWDIYFYHFTHRNPEILYNISELSNYFMNIHHVLKQFFVSYFRVLVLIVVTCHHPAPVGVQQ